MATPERNQEPLAETEDVRLKAELKAILGNGKDPKQHEATIRRLEDLAQSGKIEKDENQGKYTRGTYNGELQIVPFTTYSLNGKALAYVNHWNDGLENRVTLVKEVDVGLRSECSVENPSSLRTEIESKWGYQKRFKQGYLNAAKTEEYSNFGNLGDDWLPSTEALVLLYKKLLACTLDKKEIQVEVQTHLKPAVEELRQYIDAAEKQRREKEETSDAHSVQAMQDIQREFDLLK
jgi:hypothetical protein